MINLRNIDSKIKFLFLSFLLLILVIFSMFIGPVRVSMYDIGATLYNETFGLFLDPFKVPEKDFVIVYYLREPEILAALVVGSALGIGGAVVQSIFRNPITEPYIIGVSSGAALGAVASIGYSITFLGFYSTQIFAFLFALIIVFIIYGISSRRGRVPVTYFLLIGISISLFVSSLVAYVLITNVKLEGEEVILSWLLGSLQAITWKELTVVFFIVLVTSLVSMLNYRELDTMQMGEDFARSVGVNVERTKKVSIVAVALGVSAVVSISGLIGFVGLIVPHVGRLLFGGSNRYVIPASALIGSIFLLCANDLSTMIISQEVVPVGIITAFVGVPVFIYLLHKLAVGSYES